jgi:hypothetical protein
MHGISWWRFGSIQHKDAAAGTASGSATDVPQYELSNGLQLLWHVLLFVGLVPSSVVPFCAAARQLTGQ